MKGKSMRELREGEDLKTFMDPRLIRALGHPVREHILAVLNERIASGKEIGDEIGADVSSFYHHIKELERLGCIERVGLRKRRGWKEHRFKATRTLYFDDREWQNLPPTVQSDVDINAVQRLFDEVVQVLMGRSKDADEIMHLSWTSAVFDARGWAEAKALADEALTRLDRIREEAEKRLADEGGEGVQASVAMLAFETGEAEA